MIKKPNQNFLKVKVFPGAKKEIIKTNKNGSFDIHIKEEAKKNMANERIIEIIREKISPEAKNLKIISGHKKPSKIILAEY
jgi:uncharacterized protein YggU (UPF0235/DUF167 family)